MPRLYSFKILSEVKPSSAEDDGGSFSGEVNVLYLVDRDFARTVPVDNLPREARATQIERLAGGIRLG